MSTLALSASASVASLCSVMDPSPSASSLALTMRLITALGRSVSAAAEEAPAAGGAAAVSAIFRARAAIWARVAGRGEVAVRAATAS
jgi:hypothetical protein